MNITIPLARHFSLMILMILFVIIGIMIAHKKGSGWLKKHQRYVLLGIIFGIVGIFLMFLNKLTNGYPHFISTHSKFGLLTIILSILTPLLGLLILKQVLKLKWIHKLSGVCTLILWFITASFRISLFLG